MSTEKKDDATTKKYIDGELKSAAELFERPLGQRKKGSDWRSKLDDIAFLFDPPEGENEGPEDGSEWPYGEA